MDKPRMRLSVLPSRQGKAYYLPLAPKSKDHPERLKIALRLDITNDDSRVDSLTVAGISFSFPGTDLGIRTMWGEPQQIEPEGGVLAFGETAIWSNGSVELENGERKYNQIYLDSPAPPKIRINVHCGVDFDLPFSMDFDLIPWTDPTGDGPLRMPFSLLDMEWNEHIITDAEHWFNGQAAGTQIYAFDMGIEALVDGQWTNSYTSAAATQNSEVRVFGRPIRAMADGVVEGPAGFQVLENDFEDNPYKELLPKDRRGSNHLWVRYGDLLVNYRHLRQGSIRVLAGQEVQEGQKLAEAGNSGRTGGDPHLHMECRLADTGTLCGFTFRSAWQLAKELVLATGDPGRRVSMDGRGVCQERAAIRPFSTIPPRPSAGLPDLEREALVAEIFGGVSKGGGGFAIVGGRIVKVPPRGIRADLLKSLAELDAAAGLSGAGAAARRKAASALLERALRDLAKER